MLSGTPKPQPAPNVGDRVALIFDDERRDELIGWVLNLPEGKIRIADHPNDDGRPDTTWWRATEALSEVTVITLSPAALAHTERHTS